FDELDELVDNCARLGHALVVALDRQAVTAQANRAAKPVAKRVEHAIADRGQLCRDVVRNREHLLHGLSLGGRSLPAVTLSTRFRHPRVRFSPIRSLWGGGRQYRY